MPFFKTPAPHYADIKNSKLTESPNQSIWWVTLCTPLSLKNRCMLANNLNNNNDHVKKWTQKEHKYQMRRIKNKLKIRSFGDEHNHELSNSRSAIAWSICYYFQKIWIRHRKCIVHVKKSQLGEIISILTFKFKCCIWIFKNKIKFL